MAFTPLTKQPNFNTKWYLAPSNGGVNRCQVVNQTTGSTVPNCTGYAWGRFSELLGSACSLPTTDASTWYSQTTAYKKGQEPKVGAVAVWSKQDYSGLVGIVESVSEDSITVSLSSYNGSAWYTNKMYKADKYSYGENKLEGFIYNPKVDENNPVEKFLEIVCSWKDVNPGAEQWVRKKVGYPSGAWCCAFVWACAKEAGLSGKIIPATPSSSAMMEQGVNKCGGRFIVGPYFTHTAVIPQPGDIFGRHKTGSSAQYKMQHVGVVVSVNTKTGKFKTVEGNTTGSKCAGREYEFTRRDIGGFLRPNWAKVGGSAVAYDYYYKGDAGYQNIAGYLPVNIYDSESTAEDATLRECCYLSSTGQPTTASTSIALSAINYTSGVASLLQATGGYATAQSMLGVDSTQLPAGVTTSSQIADASKFKSKNAQIIFNYLVGSGMNIAQAIGMLGNIQHESGFKPSEVNKGSGASGIVQWLGGRKTAMIKHCGANWKTNLQGQMEFIWIELKGSEKGTWTQLKNKVTANTLEMARRAAVIICNSYERPFYRGMTEAQKQRERDIRAKYAEQLWSKLVITQNTSNKPVSQASNQSGQTGDELPQGKQTQLPNASKQTGVTQEYMNYSFYFDRWRSNSTEEKIANIWQDKGRRHKRRIAVIDDYFLIVVSPNVGKVGEILTVVLSDGMKFNAIVCQNITYNSSEWGKVKDGKIQVITWAKAGLVNQVTDSRELDLTGWAGKAITYVINYGSYLK